MGAATIGQLAAGDRRFSMTSDRMAFWSLMLFAMLIRLATLANPSSYFPDEIFQYLDVAHARVFGYGVETWEQRYGIRSPILPLILSAPMYIGKWADPDGFAFLFAAKALLALASMGVVWGAYRLGRSLSPTHGLFAGFVAAIWFEFVYFSTQALTESFALSFFFPAAALLLDQSPASKRSICLGGFLLACAALVRFQYAPALIVFGALACRRDVTRWLFAGCGAIAAIALSVAIDLSQGLTPFSWVVANYHHNITLGRSHAWTDGPAFYLIAIPVMLGPLVALQIIPARIGGQIFMPLAICAIFNLAVHSLIAHKEYRYILLSTAILTVLAALGTVEFFKRPKWRTLHSTSVCFGAVLLWLTASFISGTFGQSGQIWSVHRAELQLFQLLNRDKSACGVAIYGHHWSETGGYTYLHRRIPIYVLDHMLSGQALRTSSPAFNRLLGPDDIRGLPKEFKKGPCAGRQSDNSQRLCVYRRSGPCQADTAEDLQINAWLKQRDL